MTARRKLTAARVRQLLDCDPERGTLTWRERPDNPSFNVQWAGKPAGAVDPSTGYLRLMVDGKHQYVHRIVFLHAKGWLPPDLDHIDGDKSNCALSNLRPATKTQNNCNRRVPRKGPGPRGAWLNPKTGKYQVNIWPGGGKRGQSIYLGAYSSPEAAGRAYREAAEDLHGAFAFTERPTAEQRGAA
jgi:hypothetical protein